MIFVVVSPGKRESVGFGCSDKKVTIVCRVSAITVELADLGRFESDVSIKTEKVGFDYSVTMVGVQQKWGMLDDLVIRVVVELLLVCKGRKKLMSSVISEARHIGGNLWR
jgi:hypothetical protein